MQRVWFGAVFTIAASCCIAASAVAVAQEQAGEQQVTELSWPRDFGSGSKRLEVYQPQIESWTGDHLSGRAGAFNWNTGGFAAGRQGSFANPSTGIAGAGRAGIAGNVATGDYQAGRQVAGANAQTGRIGAAERTVTGNVRTGDRSVQRQGAIVNPRTQSGVAWRNGDVYAGHDGNVYRHTDGGWQQRGSGGWQPVQRDNRAFSDLDAQRGARGLGQMRVNRSFGGGRFGGIGLHRRR